MRWHVAFRRLRAPEGGPTGRTTRGRHAGLRAEAVKAAMCAVVGASLAAATLPLFVGGAPPVALAASAARDNEGAEGSLNNQVIVHDDDNGALRVRGHVDLASTDDYPVRARNLAEAVSVSCRGCTTIAVALQIVLVLSRPHGTIVAENRAVAINIRCKSCTTLAVAIQYVFVEPHLPQITDKQRDLVEQLNHALGSIHRGSIQEVLARLNTIIGEFGALAHSFMPASNSADPAAGARPNISQSGSSVPNNLPDPVVPPLPGTPAIDVRYTTQPTGQG